MRTDPLPHEVRELVLRTFQDFGVAIFSSLDLDETILVDDGRYAGGPIRPTATWRCGCWRLASCSSTTPKATCC